METPQKKRFSHRSSSGLIDTTTPDVQEARKGLLKAMVLHKVAPIFSSGPMDFCDESGRSSAGSSMFSSRVPGENNFHDDSTKESSIVSGGERASLTQSERSYLERLLKSANPKTIRQASDRLSDKTVFPLNDDEEREAPPVIERRDSKVQQELFRFHEQGSLRPSTLLRRLSSRTASPSLVSSEKVAEETSSLNKVNEDDSIENVDKEQHADVLADWLDASQGVEVDGDGAPLPAQAPPFLILGTAADDVICHPHVLSPPLMEGIQAFMPESLAETHFWLKYSLLRDGPGLMKLLRSIRGSVHTILAIETTEGYVFGSFTSRPWRLSNGRYFGSKESFLWRMRHSRLTPCQSVVEQATMEGELEVFPYVQSNNAVQRCNRDGIALGKDELQGSEGTGEHYGSALFLNADLAHGTTSTSETFANPCLTSVRKRGEEFKVSNIEVWTTTPHDTVQQAEEEELSLLFFEETHDRDKAKIDLLGILVGSPYGQVHT